MSCGNSIITLTSDFGNRGGYVGAMKGVMLRINPKLTLFDITHEVQVFDVMAAAFVLQQSLAFYPPETTHLVVVDPGVGSERRAVALKHNHHYFVGADNGLFTLLLKTETPDQMVELKPAEDQLLSATFHGRDLFAPVAAKIASGTPLEELGTPFSRLTPLHWASPISDVNGIQGWVVYIDHFGNCITNISRDIFEVHSNGRNATGYVGSGIIRGIHTTYSDEITGEALMLFGSNDFLEIAINQGNAASLLQIQRGTPVNIVFGSPTS